MSTKPPPLSKVITSGIIEFTVILKAVSPDNDPSRQGDTQACRSRPCIITVTEFPKGLREQHLPEKYTLSQSVFAAGVVTERGSSGKPRIDLCSKSEQLELEEGVTFVAFARYPARRGRTRDLVVPRLVGVMTKDEYNKQVSKLPPRVIAPPRESGLAAEILLAPDEQEAIERIAQARKHDPRFQTPPRHGKLSKGMKIAPEQTTPPGTSEEAA